jgi:hypothetical protein
MKIVPNTELKRELIDSLKPYQDNLDKWILSGYNFLSPNEIYMIASMCTFGSKEMLAKDFNCDLFVMQHFIQKTTERLRTSLIFYSKYQADIEAFGESENNKLKQVEDFLSKPIIDVLPEKLNRYLEDSGQNLLEILSKLGTNELLELRYFGDAQLQEFQAVLHRNNCLDLLQGTK